MKQDILYEYMCVCVCSPQAVPIWKRVHLTSMHTQRQTDRQMVVSYYA